MSSTSVLICTADHNVVLLGPINYPVDEDPALLSHPSSSPPQAAPPAPNLTHLRTLLQQLDDVGWDRAALSADLTSVTLRLVDAGGRHHNAVVHLPAGFPTAPPTVALPLPTPFKVRWLPGDSLTTLVSQLEKVRVSPRGRATTPRYCVHPPKAHVTSVRPHCRPWKPSSPCGSSWRTLTATPSCSTPQQHLPSPTATAAAA